MSPLTGRTTNTNTDVILNPGVVYIGATPIGVTRGGVQFDPGHEFENIDFDGRQAPLYLGDRKYNGVPKLTFKMIEMGDASTGNQAAKLEVGSSAASAGSPNVTTVTPAVGGSFLAAGDYQSNVRVIFDRGAGTGTKRYLAVLFAKAFVAKYSLAGGATRGEAEISVEIEGRKDMASGTIGDAAYVIEYREATP